MRLIARVLSGAVAITAASAYAQAPEYPQQPSYSNVAAYQQAVPQQELDAILAPIALYPDELLSQLLMAATFPQDVAQAAEWSRANPGLKGDEAVRAVDNQPWAPAVKSMVAFPDVLKAMGDQPDWTRKLGEAFLASESNVLQTVQGLRQRADKAGNLRSSDQLAVTRQGDDYALASPSQEQVYVPYYDPRTTYGEWMYPETPPVYWNPWPGYAYYGGWGFGWGPAVYVGVGFFYGGFNWHNHYVHYSGHRPYYWHGNDYWRGWRNDRRDGRNWNASGNGNWNGRPRNPGNGSGNWSGNGNGGGNGTGNWNGQGRGNQGWRPPQRQEGWQNVQRPVRVQEGNQVARTYNPSVRTAAPRYGLEGGGRVVRPTQVQGAPVQGAQVQRVPTVRNYTPRPQAPNAGVPQGASMSKPMHSAPAPVAQAAQRSFQPQHSSGGGGHQGSGGGNRGGGNNGGGNHGRER